MDASNYGLGRSEPQPVAVEASEAVTPAQAAPLQTAPVKATPELPKGDTAKAVAFLVALIEGLLAVAAIDPEAGSCHGATFALPAERDQLAAWIEARQGKYNLHFTLNEPVPRDLQQGAYGRVCKADITGIRGVVIDCDPHPKIEAEPDGLKRERKRLWDQALDWRKRYEASAVIDSGGGYQGVWLLREPLPATPENVRAAEAHSRGLAHIFGGDSTHDVSHPFRIPFTVNLPNATKREKGRVPALTEGKVFDDPRRLHTLRSLAIQAPPMDKATAAVAAGEYDLSAAWEAIGDPEKLDPDLLARLRTARANRPQLDKVLSAEPALKGERSDRDYKVAANVIEGGILDLEEIAAIVAAYSPDKFQDEAEQRGDDRAERYLAYTVAKALTRVGPQRFFNVIEEDAGTSTSTVIEPVDIFGDDDPADLSTPPVGSLPDVIAPIVRTLSRQMGVPESFVAVAAVAALGGTIGSALKLRVRQHSAGFLVPATLPVVIVARPGRKKSPTISALLRPLKEIDRELHRQNCKTQAAWDALQQAAKGKRDGTAVALPPTPVIRRLIVDDATLEKQVRIHADNPCGIIRAPDELFAFLGSFGAYKRSGDGDRSTMLRLLDGTDISVDRVGGSVRADSALMGLIASTQPDKIRQHAGNLGTDGFLQRLIFVTDDDAERVHLDVPEDPAAVAEYERAVRGMFALRSKPSVVHLSPEARAILSETESRVRALAHYPGASAGWEGHVSKWEGLIYRITLTFHALDTWTLLDTVPVGGSEVGVTAETARRASRFVQYLVKHAFRFYAEFCEPAERTIEARWIAGHLLTRPDVLSVTARDIEKARRTLSGKRGLTRAAMRELEGAAWVAVAESGPDGPTKWAVNPRIHARFAERAEREKAQRARAQAQISAAMSAKRELNDA
ncbi:DUF3987 domain-containing protein [Methylobacterium sp. NEAU K]|uniref:DUF3987 domain-containing protein n=1 Tax=Methylobacterium sp. NEAU K TaxID=3064946 RepID=UPI002732A41B|nr:DUF3987 domain-containing protein [Methylobacterium sp. NEAU K]MDP4005780.1 DUF3987 domain-containing protein [Methylobacterium sp. NEAU K]